MKPITLLIALLALGWLAYLAWEARCAAKARASLAHVVHVNGTRGKSTVSRLIEAGLRAGGLRVFCKTTGTDPMTIDVKGREEPIHRRGKANIKEQIAILRRAAAQKAQVLVVECMAVHPEYQYAAQHRILKADTVVITNVRRDHTDVMGETLPEICDALCNTVPKNGALFTAETAQAPRMGEKAAAMGSSFHPIRPDGSEPGFDFAENIALALAVCEHLGVDRQTALSGMAHFKRDPYALTVHRMGEGLFVNGLSINDVQSTCTVWRDLKGKLGCRRLILLVNNRADRGSRTQDMLAVCCELCPDAVWLMGASQGFMARSLAKKLPGTPVERFARPELLPLDGLAQGEVVFAVGNIAQGGRDIMARVRQEGTLYVQ